MKIELNTEEALVLSSLVTEDMFTVAEAAGKRSQILTGLRIKLQDGIQEDNPELVRIGDRKQTTGEPRVCSKQK